MDLDEVFPVIGWCPDCEDEERELNGMVEEVAVEDDREEWEDFEDELGSGEDGYEEEDELDEDENHRFIEDGKYE
jgi:hypothetical protein